MLDRRQLMLAAAGGLASAAVAKTAFADNSIPPGPALPPRDWSSSNPTVPYPDPYVQVLDPRFGKYIAGTTLLRRVWTGADWTEGPVWFGDMHVVIFSDIPNNRLMRYDTMTGHTTVFRSPSNFSNGNTRDRQGRLVTCEHAARRVTRTEYDGKITVIADKYNGKPLNSPNGVVVKSDDSIWFTDPSYGTAGDHEGHREEDYLPHNIYRVDGKTGQMTVPVTGYDQPNGLCFSPDEKKLYITDTGRGKGGGAPSLINVYDVGEDGKLTNEKLFHDFSDTKGGLADDIRCDEDGNIWSAGGWSANPLFNGVTVLATNGDVIGRIVLPETAANLCFGGHDHNRLFICASTSLYAVDVNTRGVEL
jgi:gluconolactonase